MDLKGVGLESVDWIHLAQGTFCWRTVVNTVGLLNLQFS
jgi:hypothetical protein